MKILILIAGFSASLLFSGEEGVRPPAPPDGMFDIPKDGIERRAAPPRASKRKAAPVNPNPTPDPSWEVTPVQRTPPQEDPLTKMREISVKMREQQERDRQEYAARMQRVAEANATPATLTPQESQKRAEDAGKLIGAVFGTFFIFGLVVWMIPALLPAFIANGKGHNFWLFFFLALLFSWPLITIVALVMPYHPSMVKQ